MSEHQDASKDEVVETDDTFEVPEDLTELANDQLEELTTFVMRRGEELATIARDRDLTDDELVEGEELGIVAQELAEESERRHAELAARRERADQALSRFGTAVAEKPDTDTDDDAVAETSDDDTVADATDTPAEAATPELAVEDTADDAADTGGEGEAEVAEEMSARRPTKFRGASPGYLRSKSQAPEPKPVKRDFMSATGFSKDPEGTRYESPADVAHALWNKRMSFGNIPAGTREEIAIATGTKDWGDETPVVLGIDHQENLAILRGGQESAKAMVASGAQCTPQNQLYDFFRLAEPIRSVEDSIPTVQAPRGGIRYIQANCTIQGAGTVGIWGTESPPVTEGAIDPTSGEKPCDTVTCPNVQEVLVEAVTKCMVFDNLQYRTFPELIENFMEDVAVQFQILKERYYLDKIDAAATATTGIGAYGAARALVYDLRVAAAGYRKRHHMPRGARLNVLMPDWSVDLMKMDLFYDGDNGLSFMNVPDSAVTEALSSDGIDVTFYYDNPTQVQNNEDNASVGLTLAQAAGALNDFAPTVTSYMYAPGTWVKLDGGSLDVGLVRDHSLNKTNDFSMFMEEWIGIAQLGCETIRIDSDVCADGSRAPYATALRSCAGYGS